MLIAYNDKRWENHMNQRNRKHTAGNPLDTSQTAQCLNFMTKGDIPVSYFA